MRRSMLRTLGPSVTTSQLCYYRLEGKRYHRHVFAATGRHVLQYTEPSVLELILLLPKERDGDHPRDQQDTL